eukprot:5227896-Prymnesium_polylepis.1
MDCGRRVLVHCEHPHGLRHPGTGSANDANLSRARLLCRTTPGTIPGGVVALDGRALAVVDSFSFTMESQAIVLRVGGGVGHLVF